MTSQVLSVLLMAPSHLICWPGAHGLGQFNPGHPSSGVIEDPVLAPSVGEAPPSGAQSDLATSAVSTGNPESLGFFGGSYWGK